MNEQNGCDNNSLFYLQRIDWEPQVSDIELCTKKQKSEVSLLLCPYLTGYYFYSVLVFVGKVGLVVRDVMSI